MARIKLTFDSLYRIGVQLLDSQAPRLRCRWCRVAWSPERISDQKLERAWWKCRSGCVRNYEHARERHDEWVDLHARAELTLIDLDALKALYEFDVLLDEAYGDVGDLLPEMPISMRMLFELPSSEIEDVSNKVRRAVDAAKARGAPFAHEMWYRIWLRLRQDLGIQKYLELEYEWETKDENRLA